MHEEWMKEVIRNMKRGGNKLKIFQNKIIKKILSIGFYVWIPVLIILASVIFPLSNWYKSNIKVSIDAAIFTLRSPLKGANNGITEKIIEAVIPAFIIAAVIIAIVIGLEFLLTRRRTDLLFIDFDAIIVKRRKMYRLIAFSMAFIYLIVSLVYSNFQIDYMSYVMMNLKSTRIYQKEYVDPKTVEITKDSGIEVASVDDQAGADAVEKANPTKNLIYIYVESFETTYASRKYGGCQSKDMNLIPNMEKVAKENTSFSTNNKLRGIMNTYGNGWTFGSIFSSTSGLPFRFPNVENSTNKLKKFASGVTTLGEILEKEGYYQEFMCGSDADFAGRKQYFKGHGNYKIFDVSTAKKKGLIPEDYLEGWGFEDEKLYQYAKDELTRISSKDKPFNFTMLTCDTHFPQGHRCELCGDKYLKKFNGSKEQSAYGNTADIVVCADKQLSDFIDWCKDQDFFKNTVIVIQGDHPRMDKYLVKYAKGNERTVYNCFINSSVEPVLGEKNRMLTIMDMFPTTLAAMGFKIKGDGLGLGTNAFSKQKTLAEKMGYDDFNAELEKYSQYYIDKFS